MTEIKNLKAFESNAKIFNKKVEAEKEMAKMNGTYTEVDERLDEVFGDRDFMKQIMKCESPDAAYDLFCTRNSDLTKIEFFKIVICSVQTVENLADKEEELSMEELEQIAGGSFFGNIGKGLLTGIMALGTAVSVLTDILYNVVQSPIKWADASIGKESDWWGFKSTKACIGIISNLWS